MSKERVALTLLLFVALATAVPVTQVKSFTDVQDGSKPAQDNDAKFSIVATISADPAADIAAEQPVERKPMGANAAVNAAAVPDMTNDADSSVVAAQADAVIKPSKPVAAMPAAAAKPAAAAAAAKPAVVAAAKPAAAAAAKPAAAAAAATAVAAAAAPVVAAAVEAAPAVAAPAVAAPAVEDAAKATVDSGLPAASENSFFMDALKRAVGGTKAQAGDNPLVDSEAEVDADTSEAGHGGGGHGAHGGGHHHDYAEHLESACCIVMGLVIFTIFFETTKEILEWYLEKNHQHFELRVMERTFGEMAILGFISFVLFLIHDQKFFSKMTAWMTNDYYVNVSHMLHDVHIMLFIVMIGYILCVMYVTFLAKAAFRAWRKHGKGTGVDASDGIDMKEVGLIIEWIFFLPFDLIYANNIYRAHYKAVYSSFQNCLPPHYHAFEKMFRNREHNKHQKFDDHDVYVMYIKESTQDAMLGMVELSWHIWMLFYTCAAIMYTVTMFAPKDNSDQYIWLSIFLFCGWIPFFSATSCFLRLNWILSRFKKAGKTVEGAKPIESFFMFKGELTLIQDNLQLALVSAVIYVAVYAKMFMALERIAGVGLLVVAIVPAVLVFFIAPFVIPNYGLVVSSSGGISGKHNSVGAEIAESKEDNGNKNSMEKRHLKKHGRRTSQGRIVTEEGDDVKADNV